MPLYTPDRLTTFRDGSTNATATEAAGTNKITLPPGEYKVNLSVGAAPTGTTPTCVVSFSEAADGSTWAAAVSTSLTAAGGATGPQELTGWLRVSVAPNAGVTTGNVTAIVTIGGTTPVFPKLFIGAVPAGVDTAGVAGRP